MENKIITIEGLPGTGKSYEIRKIIKEQEQMGLRGLILCFNKDLKEREKLLSESALTRFYTVHSLCYWILKRLGQIKPRKKDALNEKFDETKETSKFCKRLIDDTLGLSDTKIKKGIWCDIDYIIVDEYQDLDTALVKVIVMLNKVFQCKLYLAGDRYQWIYSGFTNSIHKDNFGRIPKDFGAESKRIILNNLWRTSNKAVANTIGTYYRKCLNAPEAYMYCNIDEEIRFCYAKPEFRWFRHWKDEVNYVLCEARKLKSAIILCRVNYLKKQIESLLGDDEEGIVVSTIHKYKGHEADNVFVVDIPDLTRQSDVEKRVFGVAFSRAKSKLYMTSSHPKYDLSGVFDDTIKVKGAYQKNKKREPKKQICPENNYSRKALNKMRIDSISFKIHYDDAPFNAFFESGKIKYKKGKANQYQKAQERTYKGVEYKIIYNKRHKFYLFEFIDLNILRRSRFNDYDVILFTKNIIEDFFDYRIDSERIKTLRIDLCRFNFCNSEREYISKLRELAGDIQKRNHTYWFSTNTREREEALERNDINKKTCYWNCLNSGKKGIKPSDPRLTYTIYSSANKTNGNAIPFLYVLKEEIRIINLMDRKYINEELKNMKVLKEYLVMGKDLNELFKRIMIERI